MVATLAPTPTREARVGRSASACSTEPVRLTNWRKVTGPTFSLRMSRSQAIFCDGVCLLPSVLAISGGLDRLLSRTDLGLGTVQEPSDVGAVVVDHESCDQRGRGGELDALGGPALEKRDIGAAR